MPVRTMPGATGVDPHLYFTTGGVSNGPTEPVNLLVKRIKRALLVVPGLHATGAG
jgi:hypothetical protein